MGFSLFFWLAQPGLRNWFRLNIFLVNYFKKLFIDDNVENDMNTSWKTEGNNRAGFLYFVKLYISMSVSSSDSWTKVIDTD